MEKILRLQLLKLTSRRAEAITAFYNLNKGEQNNEGKFHFSAKDKASDKTVWRRLQYRKEADQSQ